jgi:hypothetical protein
LQTEITLFLQPVVQLLQLLATPGIQLRFMLHLTLNMTTFGVWWELMRFRI